MRIGLAAVLLGGLALPAGAAATAEFELARIIVQSVGAGQQTIAAVEQVIKDEAGVLSLSIEGSRTLQDIVDAECPGASEPYLASFARDVATTVCFLDGGRILEQGPPDRVLVAPEQERTRQFLSRILPPTG